MPKKQGKLIWHEVVIQILDVYVFNKTERPQEFLRGQVIGWHLFKQTLKRERTEHYGLQPGGAFIDGYNIKSYFTYYLCPFSQRICFYVYT